MTGHTHKRLFAIGITIALLVGTSWGEERTWTDVTGKFSVTAELVEVRGDKVVLRRQNGKQITVPLAKLSAEDQARAYYNLGVAYSGKGETDKAIAGYTEAIRLDPNYAQAYNDRGLSYEEIGEKAKAAADFAKAKQLGYEP